MYKLTVPFNGQSMPVVKIRVLAREIEKTTGPQIPFHELPEAREEIEYTAKGPRIIVRGKPISWEEARRRDKENPNKVFYGETEKPAFLYQLIAIFAGFKFTSAPWGEAGPLPAECFQNIQIEGSQWLILPHGLRVPGAMQDLPADERTANEMQLAREAKKFTRSTMLCNGRRLPIMGFKIVPNPYPPYPDAAQFKPQGKMPEELRTQERKQEAGKWLADACHEAELRYHAAIEDWRNQRKTNPQYDVDAEIILLGCAWRGGYVGAWIPTIEELKAGEIGPAMELELADGRKIPGRVEGLPAAEINAQKALLDEERGAGAANAELAEEMKALREDVGRKLEGVPQLVENAKEDARAAMGEFYRVIYAGLKPKEKAVCDAMIQAQNIVREASRLLIADKWKGVSPASVSRILKNIDAAFKKARKPNPFESRKFNRSRPPVNTTYKKHRTDPEDGASIEIVPNRPGGHEGDETENETP